MFGFTTKKTMNKIEYTMDEPTTVKSERIEIENDKDEAAFQDVPTTTSPIMFEAQSITVEPLDMSLHTTCSDTSIDLDVLLQAAANKTDDLSRGDELSFHVSQLEDSSILNVTDVGPECGVNPSVDKDDVLGKTNDLQSRKIYSSSQEIKVNMDIMTSVSQQLLKVDQAKNAKGQDETSRASPVSQLKCLLLLAVTVHGIATGVTGWFHGSALSQLDLMQLHPKQPFFIYDDATDLVVGDVAYHKEEITQSSGGLKVDMWHFIMIGVIAKIAFPNKKDDCKNSTIKEKTLWNDPENEKSSIDSLELNHTCSDSVPSLIPIKLEDDGGLVENFDLSKYENLTVMDLRALLRARQCSYSGRKVHLIHRVVSVYRAELENLTVIQLRRKLKSKKLKQGGLKKELVQKLVEAGL